MTEGKRSWNPLAVVLLLSAGFFALFLVISAVIFFSKSSSSWQETGKSHLSKDGIGILEIKGVITDSKKVLKRLRRFEENDSVKGLIVRINSPGGAVAPSQEIYEALKKFPKPVISSMDSLAASGGYYIACGTKHVFANKGTLTGSIGVIMEFANLRKLYEWAKIERFAIKTGKFKDTGAEFRDMNDEEKALLQALVDDTLGQFKAAVSEGRHLTMEQVTAVADGRIFTGQQAQKLKLVDELGTLDDAVAYMTKEAKITLKEKQKPRLIYFTKRKSSLLQKVLDGGGDDEDEESSDFDDETQISPSSASADLLKEISTSLSALRRVRQPGLYWLWEGAY
jgi:protease-4